MCWLRCLLLVTVATSAAAQGIINSYPSVRAQTQSRDCWLGQRPCPKDQLKILCQKEIEGEYVSFLSLDGKTALLAAFTEKKLKNPDEHIRLRLVFRAGDESSNDNRLAGPWYGDLRDWGYIFDRNGDGKVDYIAFLVGALIVSTESTPEVPPDGRVNLQQLRWALDHYQMVFTHWADDNFDGRVDGVVYDDTGQPAFGVVERWLLMRSTRFDGYLDEGFTFALDPSQPAAKLARSREGYPIRSGGLGRNEHFGEADLERPTGYLTRVNAAATACHLSATALAR